ncbi:hypothetical protein EST62_05795 [Chlorobaculum sp. 24CR]|uniref:hypothetical protein n=1 Tax=Chlorobaculum sp. 24CR TaxID=2508878 RepID=UPI00100AB613|nr:hypothetical protein [Chlorobaculum sp. 24CR]RXK87852.1 hypothetical protein EST62_05795 [Chlorobaculum sp. 24CR]
MAERSEKAYRKLFEVRLLHHYWLDDGPTLFDRLPAAQQERYLLNYNVGAFLEITPTAATEKRLKAFGALWRKTKSGFIAAAPSDAALPLDTVLEWSLKVIDPEFFNYTALTLRPQSIRECYTGDKSTRYRFKENVPVFGNLTGASRASGESKRLFLSKEIETLDAGDGIEALFEDGGAFCQLTADQTGTAPAFQTLDADKSAMPVFANQNDVPEIAAPEGVTDAPSRGLLFNANLPADLFALIRLAATRGDDGDFSFIDGDGKPLASGPVFEVRFKNRHTWWKWIESDGTESLSAEPLPMTFYGNASGATGPKPSVETVKTEMAGVALSKIVSEIVI